ncbi:P-loop containing nucleoside triphosphate hydrolase protein [Earliella scabrosa]|nr:P-loop containing nucleoside triphosphate hydrolase protein [Earliella scabrosa]
MSKNLRIRTKPISTKRRRAGRTVVTLLDKGNMGDDVAIETAICVLESHIVDPGVDIEDLIAEIESVPHLLEFVLSATNEYPYKVLHDAILQSFPNLPATYESSLASRLLDRFSVSLLFLPPGAASDRDAFALLSAHRRAVELAGPLLKVLSNLHFADEALKEEVSVSPTSPTKRRSQQKRKQSFRASRAPVVDQRPFDTYGVAVPTTQAEVIALTSNVLEEQLNILKYYLDIHRNSALADAFKTAYLPPVVPETHDLPTQQAPEEDSPVELTHAPEQKGAYPFVQPIKAALYFDSARGFGQWRILISNGAAQDLRQARRKDPTTFGIIVNKIKALSNGHFSDDNQKKLTGTETEVPIYEAKMTSNTRLVYQIDCVPEFESDVERQVIRVFGVYTHEQMDRGRLWDGVARQLGRKGPEYVKRCTYRRKPANDSGDVYIPGSWPPLEQEHQSAPTSVLDIVKEDLEEMHSLLVLEKFITFSQALLNSIMADQDVTHPFDVSPQEKRIIEHPSSCYVLGRSGTGKTTTMLFKMLGIERSWESFRETLPRPRQLFVTQSRVLAEKVEEYFAKLFESLSAAGHTSADLANLLARRKRQQEQGLVDQDEEVWHRGDLPRRFGELTDEHFPMFLTYDQVCRLLETEFSHLVDEQRKSEAVVQAIQDALEPRDSAARGKGWSCDRIVHHRQSFVSEELFRNEYWRHFPQGLTKGLDPTLVFAEFMGVIKGSEQALEQPRGYLDQDGYSDLSSRTQATFANQRDTIYRLFQAYLKRKKERGEWDAADRTHALIRSLRGGVPGQDFDFLYVDEAQDNLLIDALVLRTLCRNPHGLFWAGDTAQTISAGSAFRFNDLKAFLYRVEQGLAGVTKRVHPESFQLAVNYRSHAGIVNCAHSVIKLITEFWPNAIDTLAEEKGLIDGLKPVFFTGWDQDSARYEQFLFGESGAHIEFGAQQCILVRDEAAREKLRAEVGEIGLTTGRAPYPVSGK